MALRHKDVIKPNDLPITPEFLGRIAFAVPAPFHLKVIGARAHFTGQCVFVPCEHRLHACRIIGATGFQTCFAESGPFIGLVVCAQPDEVVTIPVVQRKFDVKPQTRGRCREENT